MRYETEEQEKIKQISDGLKRDIETACKAVTRAINHAYSLGLSYPITEKDGGPE